MDLICIACGFESMNTGMLVIFVSNKVPNTPYRWKTHGVCCDDDKCYEKTVKILKDEGWMYVK